MNVTIDGKVYEAEYGEFILDIARRNNIHIPTLCHSDALPGQANCRLCIVDVVENSRHKTVTSCVYPVTKEIEILTNSEKIRRMRKTIIMLLSARVPENKQIKRLAEEYSVPAVERFKTDKNEQCVLCGLCVRACEKLGANCISTVNRGITKKVSTPYDEPSLECKGCGSCAQVCPTGAIKVREAGSERMIWGKKFELLSCERCGKNFITREELKYMDDMVGTKSDKLLCKECKKHVVSEKFKNIYKDVTPGK